MLCAGGVVLGFNRAILLALASSTSPMSAKTCRKFCRLCLYGSFFCSSHFSWPARCLLLRTHLSVDSKFSPHRDHVLLFGRFTPQELLKKTCAIMCRGMSVFAILCYCHWGVYVPFLSGDSRNRQTRFMWVGTSAGSNELPVGSTSVLRGQGGVLPGHSGGAPSQERENPCGGCPQ